MTEPPASPGSHAGRSIHTFPSDDKDFASLARRWSQASGIRTVEDLQRALRTRYPAAIVRMQTELGRLSADDEVWYAFRYGVKGIPAAGETVPLDPAASGAWAIVDDDRRFVAVSEELAEIAETSLEEMAGQTVEAFTNPADPTAVDDIRAMWAEFKRAGVFESTIRFNHRDGRPRQLAFRIVADADGPARHRLSVVALPPG